MAIFRQSRVLACQYQEIFFCPALAFSCNGEVMWGNSLIIWGYGEVIQGGKPIRCLIFIRHFLQKSFIISGSFARNDLQLEASYGSSPLCIGSLHIDAATYLSGRVWRLLS